MIKEVSLNPSETANCEGLARRATHGVLLRFDAGGLFQPCGEERPESGGNCEAEGDEDPTEYASPAPLARQLDIAHVFHEQGLLTRRQLARPVSLIHDRLSTGPRPVSPTRSPDKVDTRCYGRPSHRVQRRQRQGGDGIPVPSAPACRFASVSPLGNRRPRIRSDHMHSVQPWQRKRAARPIEPVKPAAQSTVIEPSMTVHAGIPSDLRAATYLS